MDELKEKFKAGGDKLQKEVRERTIGYILAAFGLVAALAWNEAIKSAIETLFPVEQNSLVLKLGYAIVITIVVVVVSIYLARFSSEEKP